MIKVVYTVVFSDDGMIEQKDETKTESGKREIPLVDKLLFHLKKHKLEQSKLKLKSGLFYEDNDYVFATYSGKPYHERNIRRALNRIIKKAGLDHFTPHTLRHTFGTRMTEAGVQPTVIIDSMGHSDIKITLQIYTHATNDSKEHAMEKMMHSLETNVAQN